MPTNTCATERVSGRKIVYTYFNLPFVTRLKIARDLGLSVDSEGDNEMEIFKGIFESAKEKGLLDKLYEMSVKRTPTSSHKESG